MQPHIFRQTSRRLARRAAATSLRALVDTMASLKLTAAALLLASAQAIYPPDHWKHATQLTSANFEQVVKETVDSGKTLFVRWIASAG